MVKRVINRILLSGIILHSLSFSQSLTLNKNEYNPRVSETLEQTHLKNKIKTDLEDLVEDKPKAVSLDFGNHEDQIVFNKELKKLYPDILIDSYNRINFLIPKEFSKDSIKITEYASKSTKTLDKKLEDADILLLSGHHQVNSEIIFNGQLNPESNKYSIRAAINTYEFSFNDNIKIVFLTTCFTVNTYNEFTRNLMKKFPNAVFLGYRKRSADGKINSEVLNEFFRLLEKRDLLEMEKEEIGKLWIRSGTKIYRSLKQKRDLRAAYLEPGEKESNYLKENYILYEINSDLKTTKAYTPKISH